MTVVSSSAARRLASVLITAVSCAYTAITLVYFLQGVYYGVLAVLSMAAVVATHHVNMRAGLRGVRPSLFPATLVLQAVATYLPDLLLPGGMSALTAPMLAGSVLVLLPLHWGGALVGLMMLSEGTRMWWGLAAAHVTFFYVATIATTGAMIYALVRFVRVTVELEQARAELAEAAVLKERLRISRDLHDGLGRSLTAIALKGDLAGRLIERDPGAARTEVGELVQVARRRPTTCGTSPGATGSCRWRARWTGRWRCWSRRGWACRRTWRTCGCPGVRRRRWRGPYARASPTSCATAGPRPAPSPRRCTAARCGWRSPTTAHSPATWTAPPQGRATGPRGRAATRDRATGPRGRAAARDRPIGRFGRAAV
ncbi:histidine kinase [Nonomuraea thailandensis]